MRKGRVRFAPAVRSVTESLENRILLSGMSPDSMPRHGAAEVAASAVRNAKTQTKMFITAGTLGQPITFTVTVRHPQARAHPPGA